MKKIEVSDAALKLIEKIKAEHGPLLFHQSGGCCDGSVPMCLPKGELRLGNNDYHIGDIGDCPLYMNKDQYEYWKHLDLCVDVAKGSSGMFSLEGGEGVRFVIEGRA